MIANMQLLCAAILLTAPPNSGDQILFDFDKPAAASNWQVAKGGVARDASEGRFEITDQGELRFYGKLSHRKDGGFASIQSTPLERDLSKHDGISIRIKGDGKQYHLSIRIGVESMAGSYHLGFETVKDEWQQVFLPLASFEATTRGQVLRDAPGLNAEKIHSLGLAISHKQAGSFQMHVDWIKAAQKPSTLEERLVTAGCATCIFEMKNVTGCKLAVEIEGKHLLVKGTSIDDHGDAHAGDGLCNAARRSIVSGRVKEGVFVSSSLKLLPK